MLTGRMMDEPLLLTHFLARARTFFPKAEVVDRAPDGSLHRYTYADFHRRVCQLAHALVRLGVAPGDRVATLAWNHHRHLEAYFGVPALGAVLHTLNLRLHPDELTYIVGDAGDVVLLIDRSLLPLWNQFAARVTSVRHVVVLPDDGPAPEGMLDYERLLAAEPDHYEFPRLEERTAAALCYTSGTTGRPKGVLYSHRSTVLQTLASCMTDVLGISGAEVLLPAVPMFHANAWGLPYGAVAMGTKLILPGPRLDAVSLCDLIARERVSFAAGVPTIWMGLLAELDAHPDRHDLSSLRRMLVGGAPLTPAILEGFQRRGIEMIHAWGMTELNPLGSVARIKRHLCGDATVERSLRLSQGYAAPFVEQRHVGPEGEVLPWDGASMGELEVRGPWVASSYFGDVGTDRFTADGWFKTGDVVTIDAEGYLHITDRAKDVIKSGGEWISSVALENALMSHPAVLEAAVFAGRHPRWDERPLAAVVLKPGKEVSREELTDYLAPHFVKFWLPDDYVFLPQIPRTSTGKFLKTRLRELYGDWLLQADRPTNAG
jgi:fatty-acyl-CoA synthase